jgi:hypothetical protein
VGADQIALADDLTLTVGAKVQPVGRGGVLPDVRMRGPWKKIWWGASASRGAHAGGPRLLLPGNPPFIIRRAR